MRENVAKLERTINIIETISTPEILMKHVETSRELLKKIAMYYYEVHQQCFDAIDMAGEVIKCDHDLNDYIQKVREILNVIK